MKFYINGEKVSQKKAEQKYGKAELIERIEEAKAVYQEDPWTELAWADGLLIEMY